MALSPEASAAVVLLPLLLLPGAAWVFERGQKNGAVQKVVQDGKTYLNITDYSAMRVLFGELLREVQRIKSQGDYDACKALFENYGVQVDADIHKEVLARSEKLNIGTQNTNFHNAKP